MRGCQPSAAHTRLKSGPGSPGKPKRGPRQPCRHLRGEGGPSQKGEAGEKEYPAGPGTPLSLFLIVRWDTIPEGASGSIPYGRWGDGWGRTVRQGRVCGTYLDAWKCLRSRRVKTYIAKVKRMTAWWRGMHHPGRASAWRQWPPAPGFLLRGGLGGAQGGGGRLLRVTPWPGAGETLPVGVIWGGRRSLHSHYVLSNLSQFLPAWRLWLRRPGIHTATIPVLFNRSEKSAEPRDKTTVTGISQKVVLGEHRSWISLGQYK